MAELGLHMTDDMRLANQDMVMDALTRANNTATPQFSSTAAAPGLSPPALERPAVDPVLVGQRIRFTFLCFTSWADLGPFKAVPRFTMFFSQLCLIPLTACTEAS